MHSAFFIWYEGGIFVKIVIQRVLEASVVVEEKMVGKIREGVLVYLGVMKGDTEKEIAYLVDKLVHFRMFKDDNGKMNKSLIDVGGEILLISQFTLAADGRKGKRPSFDNAESPQKAIKLYEAFTKKLKTFNIKVETGVFGAYMKVSSVNNGPVTFIIEKQF